MIRFLLKGLLRDRSRSLFPLLTVAAGVALTVFLHAWLNGARSDIVQSTARYATGHLRVTTRAYAPRAAQAPNDLALLGADTLLASLQRQFPGYLWTPRIVFGGLLDIPDEKGQTLEQTPVSGLGLDLLSPDSPERKILDLRGAVVRGRLPERPGEILIGNELAERLHVRPGQIATLVSSTMYGSMATANFTIAGTVNFGVGPMDRSALIADLAGVREALDMQDAAGEILGFFPDNLYNDAAAEKTAAAFNAREGNAGGKFVPVMGTLYAQSGLAEILDYVAAFSRVILAVFAVAMVVVLWNAGLTGGLRRYGEFGLRLAVGEDKGRIYRSLILESLAVGLCGALLGTGIGLAAAYYLQVHGLDIGAMLHNSSMMLGNVVRAEVEPLTFVVGFVPGLLATLAGSALAGLGIYRRQTSQLFKELET